MPEKHVADRRPTYKSIKFDQRVIKLKDSSAELLFRQLILEQDNLGRHEGDANTVKESCLPMHHWISEQQVEEYLSLMHKIGLVFRYKAVGRVWLQMIGTVSRQDLVGNMVRGSALPPPPRDQFAKWLKEKRAYDDDYIAECIRTYIDNPKLDRAGRPLGERRAGPGATGTHPGMPLVKFEEATGRPFSPLEAELINGLTDQYGADRVIAAITEGAATIGSRLGVKYIERILGNPRQKAAEAPKEKVVEYKEM